MKLIESQHHPLVKHLVKLRERKRYRDDHDIVLVEGKKLIQDLSKTTSIIHLFSDDPNELHRIESTEKTLLAPQVIKKVGETRSQGNLFALVKKPSQHSLEHEKWVLVLDQIQDPGNVGTLFRTALALGWDAIYLTNGTCDPLNDKALRAAKGATFLLPWTTGPWEEFLNWSLQARLPCVVADLQGSPPKPMPDGVCLILSHEGAGPRAETFQQERVTIPMSDQCESMNVAIAGGIIMYSMQPGSSS